MSVALALVLLATTAQAASVTIDFTTCPPGQWQRGNDPVDGHALCGDPFTTSTVATTTLRPSTTSTPTTSPPTTTLAAGPTYYLAPDGSDAAAGSSAAPWKTFARAIPALRPGATLILNDGTYSRQTTGLPAIQCGPTGPAYSGTASLPITLRAAHERQAFLKSDGFQSAFYMTGCAWWNVSGLRAESTDNVSGGQLDGFPFRMTNLAHVNLQRLLGARPNRKQNVHVYAVENSQTVLLEECEAYAFHRHAFSIWQSRYITLRRVYANSNLTSPLGCCSTIDNRSYGDEAISLYGTSDSIIENSISENQANGFQIHGITNPLDPSGHGGRRNRVLGSISLNDAVAALVSSRASGGYSNARDNVFTDFVAANPTGFGLFVRGSAGTRVTNATLLRSTANGGLVADNGDSGMGGTCANPDGCSLVGRNVLSIGNATLGIGATSSYTASLVEYANAVGNTPNFAGIATANVQSRAAPEIGLGPGQCLVWIPDGSWLTTAGQDGAPIGATILRRYEDGVLTTQPLWSTSGGFPCGATVAGVNADPTQSCSGVGSRVHVNVGGCPFPAGYP